MVEYLKMNNDVLNIFEKTGHIDREKDKLATKNYFLEEINPNTVFFHDLKEKLDYLVEEDYYEKEFLNQYSFAFIKKIFNIAYSYKFRFPSFMSASKFYSGYALKTRDGKRYLERYEDRIAIASLYIAKGDKKLAENSVRSIMESYQPATPSILNAGKKARGEMVSCFKLLVDDDMNNIAQAIGNALQLSRLGGGVGLSLTDIRPLGDPIKEILNRSSGVMPVAKLLENSFSYANQLGQRQGSGVIYLNIFHADIEQFISAKKPNADEKIRLATLSTGVVIPDIFFELLKQDKDIVLFSPYDIKNEYGVHMSDMSITEMYYELLDNPNIRNIKKINARKLYTEIKKTQFESGYPFEVFDDNVNEAHALNHLGRVKMSNLCVTGDSLLLTEKGYKRADELYKTQEKLKVIIDNRTKNFNSDEKGVDLVTAIPMQMTAKNAEVFKIKTKQGFEIKATEWHKFYVQNKRGEIVKKQLNQLEIGEKLLVQSEQGCFGENSDVELAYLMGIIAGDGSYSESGAAKVYLYGDKKHLKDKIEKIMENLIKKYYTKEVQHHTAIMSPTFNLFEKTDKYQVSSKPLGDVLNAFGFNKDTKTELPTYVLNGTKEVQCAYLSGLYQMDGTVNGNAKSMALTIELTSIKESLLKSIQLLLINMGIYSTLYTNRNKGQEMLPDGKGGAKLFDVKQTFKLSVQDRFARERFISLIELKKADIEKFEFLSSHLKNQSRKPKHKFTAEIQSIEFYGVEDVYDTTQEDYHSLIFNGLVTGNCTEILQYQKHSVINDYFTPDEIGLDVSCNLGSLDIHNSTKSDFENTVDTATRLLVNVSDMTFIKEVPSVAEANHQMHSIGLGVMNLHGHLAHNEIQYGSSESIEFVDYYMEALNYFSLKSSNQIAIERKATFYGFEGSKYQTGEYFNQYVNKEDKKPSESVLKALGSVPVITKEMWNELKQSIMKYGLYNSYRLAIAPTGSISYIRSSTASMSPITEQVEIRDYGDSRTIYPMPFLQDSNKEYFVEAYEMDMYKMIDLYATAQKHIDQGISMTLYVTDQWNTEQLTRLYYYAWMKKIKTVYYVRQRMQTLEECVSCSI